MPEFVYLIISALVGYLFGAVPVGYIVVRFKTGKDLRQIGSGRTGGTNSFRAAGAAAGIIVSIFDVLKAACGVWLVRALFAGTLDGTWLPWAEVAAGVLSVVGHNWSIFIGWHGGAGTGPNVGWSGAIWFPIVPIAILVVLGVLYFIGYASVASLAMSAVIVLSFVIFTISGTAPFDATLAYAVGSIVGALIVVWSLRPNIRRLLAGNERVVGPRAKKQKKASEGESED